MDKAGHVRACLYGGDHRLGRISALNAVDSWEPDIQVRLHARLKEQSYYQSTITVSEELARWFESDRNRITALPVYVRSFEVAIQEVSAGSKDVKPEDIRRGTQQAARGLVPASAATSQSARSARFIPRPHTSPEGSTSCLSMTLSCAGPTSRLKRAPLRSVRLR